LLALESIHLVTTTQKIHDQTAGKDLERTIELVTYTVQELHYPDPGCWIEKILLQVCWSSYQDERSSRRDKKGSNSDRAREAAAAAAASLLVPTPHSFSAPPTHFPVPLLNSKCHPKLLELILEPPIRKSIALNLATKANFRF
jgi:hypothetical protein